MIVSDLNVGAMQKMITAPIFTKPHFLQGFLEGTLNLNLTTLESNQTRTIYTIDNN